ncbi:MAG: hypothetical protein GY870_19390 [archaeon]|nr:hypothetical protein [archaeon]
MMTDEIQEGQKIFPFLEAMLKTILKGKEKHKKGQNKLKRFTGRINFALRTSEDEVEYINLIAKHGKFEIGEGKLDKYHLELHATMEDLTCHVLRAYSLVYMFTSKNKYGSIRLKIKKMLIHPIMALKLDFLLIPD